MSSQTASRYAASPPDRPLVDRFGRHITYLRISVTDRCDFRCLYCMSEQMQFLPRKHVLDFEEVLAIADAFIARGTRRIRLTGGEPLVRRDVMELIRALGRRIGNDGLRELTLTTNGSQLASLAEQIAKAGVRRINVSLDTLDPDRFATITRRGRLGQVLEGIAAARAAGLAVKINMVAMRGVNDNEIESMMDWAHGQGMGLTLIEGMPLGEVAIDRADTYLPLRELYLRMAERYELVPAAKTTGGPARYYAVRETGGMLGFISPMSHNFCESCNRVRLTATGRLVLCLGQEDGIDLRKALRDGGPAALDAALDHAMIIKPKGHDFVLDREPVISRHMSVTGG